MKARKTPSGSWRVEVYIGRDDSGKVIKKSITNKNKKEALRLAYEYSLNKEKKDKGRITFGEAAEEYLNSKSEILSPSSVRGYRAIIKRLEKWQNRSVKGISQKDIQSYINELSAVYAPKTVRNTYGFITAVLNSCEIYPKNISLPQKVKTSLHIPSDDEIKVILAYFKENDSDMYLATLCGAVGCMRRSEVAALKSSDLTGNTLHIQRAMVYSEKREWIVKTTKTYESNRIIQIPDILAEEIAKRKRGNIIEYDPSTISHRFSRALSKIGAEHFRFHDLRHYCASKQLYLGIPLKDIQQYGGWSGTDTLNKIYLHVMQQENVEIFNRRNDFFDTFK